MTKTRCRFLSLFYKIWILLSRLTGILGSTEQATSPPRSSATWSRIFLPDRGSRGSRSPPRPSCLGLRSRRALPRRARPGAPSGHTRTARLRPLAGARRPDPAGSDPPTAPRCETRRAWHRSARSGASRWIRTPPAGARGLAACERASSRLRSALRPGFRPRRTRVRTSPPPDARRSTYPRSGHRRHVAALRQRVWSDVPRVRRPDHDGAARDLGDFRRSGLPRNMGGGMGHGLAETCPRSAGSGPVCAGRFPVENDPAWTWPSRALGLSRAAERPPARRLSRLSGSGHG